jgi:predicted nucleic acid-binding protein
VTRGLADTSVFIARESGRALDASLAPATLAISVITLAELRAGVLGAANLATRGRRLATLESVLSLDAVPIDTAVADAWADLRVRLREAGRRMKANDAWIAATAIALDVPVVTQDADFDGVPLLRVIRV